ncbi:c-type cytochrome [Parahaliea mediterranea]|uniref:C-type cytochrome n=1 Tax=Parahaliea mediterranea TaxID=651086 RepID=A0A939IMJ7_9GAMM|nr:c-type cytochrome [Parahaliea mediterranea]MBN7797595.1 c-type cytochrome [Parahaliea mediterranea]
MRIIQYLLLATLAAGAGAARSQPPAFAVCAACHAVSAPTAHGIGPSLTGIVGRSAGSAEGFMYSPALGGADILWTTENLDRFLENPAETVPGNYMAFQGVADPALRRAIIDYLADR